MGQIFWTRGDTSPLSTHFSKAEFTCQCKNSDCQDQMIEQQLIDKLEQMRNDLGQPIKINSGFRCAKHQQELREGGLETAVGKSTHELGQAADISCPIPIDDLMDCAAKYFLAIGKASKWLHCDLRGPAGKIRRWTYKT